MASSSLRFYIDTADVSIWRTWLSTGLFYGVTCNPLLLERANVPCNIETLQKLTLQAEDLGAREIHLQAWGDSVVSLIKVGRELDSLGENVVVKLPATQMGTTAAAALVRHHSVRVTLTAIYEVHQVLIAAAIGADYAAPYLGRINDLGRKGIDELVKMQRSLDGTHSRVRLLTASIRSVEDITTLAAAGVDTFTFSDAIAQSLFNVPDTIKATADFERAAREGASG